MNAHQYLALVHTYPFSSLMHRYYGYQQRDSTARVQYMDSVVISGIPQWRYTPGRVVTRNDDRSRRGDFFMYLPTVEVFADSTFIANHCFHSAGLAALDDSTFFRIDFTAASSIRSPDIEGSIFLDPATLQVRRTILRLTRSPSPMMTSAEVTADYAEMAPSIPVLHNVFLRQTYNQRGRVPVLFEEQRLVRVEFHRGAPAGSHR